MSQHSRAYPPAKSDCVCGSGKRFKRCCKPLVERNNDDLNALGDVERTRREYTSYWLQYTAHKKEFPAKLVEVLASIDSAAFVELAENLVTAIVDKQSRESGRSTIAALRHYSPWSDWPERVAYLRALTELHADWSKLAEDRARNCFKNIAVDRIQDAGALQVYWQLHAGGMGLGEKLPLLSRLIESANTAGTKIQYRMNRVMLYAVSGDLATARKETSECIREYEAGPPTSDKYGRMWYGMALAEAGNFDAVGVERAFERAQNVFAALLAEPEFTSAGRAHIYALSGDAYLMAERPADALAAYQSSEALAKDLRVTIAAAEALLHLGRDGEARDRLMGVDYVELDTAKQYDWCVALAEAALHSHSSSDLAIVDERLKSILVPHATFSDRLRGLQARVASHQNEVAKAELNALREELRVARSVTPDIGIAAALAAHLAMPPKRQIETLPLGRPLSEFLLEITTEACSKLLDQDRLISRDARSLEDGYTGFIVSLLQQRVASLGWSGNDQNQGGRAANDGAERGRRDIAFSKGADAPFWLIEAIRCASMGASELGAVREHAERLMVKYDRIGSSELTLLVFAEVKNFQHFEAAYLSGLPGAAWSLAPMTEVPAVMDSWRKNGLVRARLKPYRTVHCLGDQDVTLVHVLVHVGSD